MTMSSRNTSNLQNPAVADGPVSHAKTFAYMARRIGITVAEDENDPASQPSAPLTGIVKLPSGRTANYGICRSTQNNYASDISGFEHDGDNVSLSTNEDVDCLQPYSKATSSPFHVISRHHSSQARSENLRSVIDDPQAELFGNLPDPAHLHEWCGEFDGQVVFVGHPDRDVSAHQWSSASFQWENLGRYSQAQGKIEGPLATDQIIKYEACDNVLIRFKSAAENQEKLVMESRRSCQTAEDAIRSTLPLPFDTRNHTDTASIAQERFASSTRGKTDLNQPSAVASALVDAQAQKKFLDDPFLIDTTPVEMPRSGDARLAGRIDAVKGSLNYEYQFPVKATNLSLPLTSIVRSSTTCKPHMRGGAKATEGVSDSTFRDINYGEEASSERTLLDANSSIFVYNEQAISPHSQVQGHNAVQRYGAFQATARSLFPPVGPTVANPTISTSNSTSLRNPHHNSSYLNHTAVAHSNDSGEAVFSGTGELATPAASVAATAALQFSDPDVLHRQRQEHEIVNDLSQQAPTIQNFKGPFFTESKPTAHDPTVSLSTHVTEKEKLQNWFRDGHRPARQREHAMSLVSAATVISKSQGFRTIRETMRGTDRSRFENTGPFIRLYEGLSEYVEEYHNGGGGSYFTRTWKAAPSQMRDVGTDGNNSYFTGDVRARSRFR